VNNIATSTAKLPHNFEEMFKETTLGGGGGDSGRSAFRHRRNANASILKPKN